MRFIVHSVNDKESTSTQVMLLNMSALYRELLGTQSSEFR
jgi:hypothetical protein